jgi:hypothetical protein
MFDVHIGTPMTLDVARGVSPFDGDDETWFLEPAAAIADAWAMTPDGQVPWVVCGVARLEDLRDIDVIESIASIDAEFVRMTELVPLNASTTQQLEQELADALGVLDGLESAYEEQRERVEEQRREECEDDE